MKCSGLILFEHRMFCEENSVWLSNSELKCKSHRENSVFQHLQSLPWTCVVSGYGTALNVCVTILCLYLFPQCAQGGVLCVWLYFFYFIGVFVCVF